MQKFRFIDDNAPSGEIGPLYIFHQLRCRNRLILHICFCGIDHFSQIVRGNTRSHADSDSFRAIHQEVWQLHRQYHRLPFCLVEIWHEIHHIFVQIGQKCFLGDLLQSRLRITHGGSAIPFDIAKVTVAIHKWQPLLKLLCHNNKSIIDGTVPMRMVFAHRIPYDSCTFSIRPVISDTQFIHIVEGTPLYRFQPVPHIRQSPGDNDAHGIVNIGFLHDLRIFCLDNPFIHDFLLPYRFDICITVSFCLVRR